MSINGTPDPDFRRGDWRTAVQGGLEAESRGSEPFEPSEPAFSSEDALPAGPDAGFGARYTKLGYDGAWDFADEEEEGHAALSGDWNENWQVSDFPDVVVDFDGNGTKWVFWRGLGFVPSLMS